MNIAIISYRYPGKHNSSDFVFVKNLVDEFARQGHKCVVVSPFNCLRYKQLNHCRDKYKLEGGETVTVFRPNYISASNVKLAGIRLSYVLHKRAVNRALKQMLKSGFKPDAIYCHFWESGEEAYKFARHHKIPLFVASGESSIDETNKDGHLDGLKNYHSGVICVSTKNKNESIECNLTADDKCFVSPNAIDEKLFRKLDKSVCRKQLNLPQDKFIIAFVGWFSDRKGSKRVSQAIDRIDTKDVYSIFIGSGEDVPTCSNILFKGKVPHNEVPIYLNAADVFVLPTLREGCCNSVVEAMACGLPIISSNLPFNWDVLNERNSIMVDPNDIEGIKEAVILLKGNDTLLRSMSNAALESAANLTIGKRARGIVEFMQNKICENSKTYKWQ